MKMKQFNEEVYFPDEKIIKLDRSDINNLREAAKYTKRSRMRLCAHGSIDEKIHEMFIIHNKETYVTPHKHLAKSESFHIIEGNANVVIFDDAGNVTEVIPMGDYSSGRIFYFRLSDPYYHTLLIESDHLIFHETTNGPFKRSDTIVAPWAPGEENITAQKEFIKHISQTVRRFLSANEKSEK